MRTLYISIGNSLRGDDGLAHRLMDAIPIRPPDEQLSVVQLTPELAAEFTGFDRVIFADASAVSGKVELTAVEGMPAAMAVSHHLNPVDVVAYARHLYGWSGKALLCHLPARKFTAKYPRIG